MKMSNGKEMALKSNGLFVSYIKSCRVFSHLFAIRIQSSQNNKPDFYNHISTTTFENMSTRDPAADQLVNYQKKLKVGLYYLHIN